MRRMVLGGQCTDCRSLYDHVVHTGKSLPEKRVGMDIADMREGIDEDSDVFVWQDTHTMAADALTKETTGETSLDVLVRDGKYTFWCQAAEELDGALELKEVV